MSTTELKVLAVLLLVGGLGALWFFRDEVLPTVPETSEIVPVVTPDVSEPTSPEPEHPVATVPTMSAGELVPLPPLDDSDAYFLLALLDAIGPDIENLLITDALIDRFVATIDSLPRNQVAEKIRPTGRLSNDFIVGVSDDGSEIYLSANNFERYDPLANRLLAMDVGDVTDTYRRFYPLFQESYQRLGYPDGHFNDRVIEVIDHLLQTPQPPEPVRLARPHVLYEFADPDLEALSAGQKLLLRMGTDNAGKVQVVLGELRARLATPE